jgi:dihydrodipicolinate synthase/N-acetylneuraminate lyase
VLEDTDLLEGLDDLAVDGARGIDVVVGAGATVLDGAVDLAEAANTNGLTEVDVTSDGSGTDVVPSKC